jgi:hypothetical protein
LPVLENHLNRFVGATGERLRPSNFWVIWQTARKRVGLEWVRFHDTRHFAATMFATTGASTKEIMSRGGWKSVTMVVRYEHASEERDALLAQALNAMTQSENVMPIGQFVPGRASSLRALRAQIAPIRARSARIDDIREYRRPSRTEERGQAARPSFRFGGRVASNYQRQQGGF